MQEEILNEWIDPKCIFVQVSMRDVTFMFKQEFQATIKKKDFSMKNRGDTMKRLSEEIQRSQENQYTKKLSAV